ncbi:MAG: NADH-quinone oxidoreductase subunit NuoE [Phycisphaerae bacterium]
MAPTAAAEMDLAPADAVIERYGADRSWLVMILQDVQEAYNWLPEPVLVHVAERLEVPLSQVYHVATFYASLSLTKRGEHVIRVCDGTACHLKGAGWLVDEFRRQLDIAPGETTEDRQFTLETVACLGACALAPVVTVDGTYYGQMTPEKVRDTLDRYGNQPGD